MCEEGRRGGVSIVYVLMKVGIGRSLLFLVVTIDVAPLPPFWVLPVCRGV